jgi:hypothetical protein
VSFDIFLAHYEQGELRDASRPAVLAALRARRHTGPDEFGFYNVDCGDAGDLEFSASGLETAEPFSGCACHVRGFGPSVAEFIFDVARAGAMVIVPAMDENPLIFVDDGMREHVPDDMLRSLRPVTVGSASELYELLRGGFGAWADYRDHVLRRR